MLNGIWLSFFIAAFAASLWQWLVGGDSEIFARLVQSLFDMARVSVDIILVLLAPFRYCVGFISLPKNQVCYAFGGQYYNHSSAV